MPDNEIKVKVVHAMEEKAAQEKRIRILERLKALEGTSDIVRIRYNEITEDGRIVLKLVTITVDKLRPNAIHPNTVVGRHAFNIEESSNDPVAIPLQWIVDVLD